MTAALLLKEMNAHEAVAHGSPSIHPDLPVGSRSIPLGNGEGHLAVLILNAVGEGFQCLGAGEVHAAGKGTAHQNAQHQHQPCQCRLPCHRGGNDEPYPLLEAPASHRHGGRQRAQFPGILPGAHQFHQGLSIGEVFLFAQRPHRALITGQLAVLPGGRCRQPHQRIEPVENQAEGPGCRPDVILLPPVAELMGEHMPPAHRVCRRLGGEIHRRTQQSEQAGGTDPLRHPHWQRTLGNREFPLGAPELPGKPGIHPEKPSAGAERSRRPDQDQGREPRQGLRRRGSFLRRGRFSGFRSGRGGAIGGDDLHPLGQEPLCRLGRREIQHTGGRGQRHRHQQAEQHHQPQPIAEPAAQPSPAEMPQCQHRQDQHRGGEQQFTGIHHGVSPPLPCGAVLPAPLHRPG